MPTNKKTVTDNTALAVNDAVKEVVAQKEKKLRGRGGTGNFPNSRANYDTADTETIKQILAETLHAYKMPRVKSLEELETRLDEYFTMCGNKGQIPTVEEMALYTGYTTSTLWDWENERTSPFGPGTSEVIKSAKEFLKAFDAKMVETGKLNFLAYCYRSKNYYGMTDKQEIVLTPNNPLGNETTQKELEEHLNIISDIDSDE